MDSKKKVIAEKAHEAVEGAVCYLQQQLEPQGVTLTDAQAHRIIKQTASSTKTSALFARA
jgi:hypothetical protein